MNNTHPDSAHSGRSTTELINEVADSGSRLVRDEMRLAASEMRVKAKKAGLGIGLAGAASLCGILAAMALVVAAGLAIALVLPGWLSALIVAGGLLLLAGAAGAASRSEIGRAVPAVPEAAVASAQEDIRAVRGGMRR